jgi:hypothetical protein
MPVKKFAEKVIGHPKHPGKFTYLDTTYFHYNDKVESYEAAPTIR